MRPAPHEVVEPSAADLDAAGAIIARQPRTSAQLVFLRDKGILFNAERTGFLMYGVQGRTWVTMGDPVGPPETMSDLIRVFLERCDDFDGIPVFYEVGKAHLHYYADFGLTFVKVGEEARVDLDGFSLDGSVRRAIPAGRSGGSRKTGASSGSFLRQRSLPSCPACAPSRTTGSPRAPAQRKASRSASSTTTMSSGIQSRWCDVVVRSSRLRTSGAAPTGRRSRSISCGSAGTHPKA